MSKKFNPGKEIKDEVRLFKDRASDLRALDVGLDLPVAGRDESATGNSSASLRPMTIGDMAPKELKEKVKEEE